MPAKPHILVLGGGFAALEAAFLLRMRLRDRVEIKLVSDSDQFLFRPNSIYVPFGADPASLLVDLHKPLWRRDVSFEAGKVTDVDPDSRLVALADGQRFGYDKLIVATGADTHAGHDDVYAPGDAGDFPIKQAFLQADSVAHHIASEVEGRAFEEPFDAVSMCIMEMFDKATFAQVPIEVTGDPQHPVRVRPGAEDDYKVGTSPVWRLGKKMLGFSVPMLRGGRAVPCRQGLADDGRGHRRDARHARRLMHPGGCP